VKTEYPEYWRIVKPLIAVGGLIIADNVLGSGDWWIDDERDATRAAADQFSRTVAGDRDFETVAVPLRQGVLIGRRARSGA
jgi:predicted O-methyltransferase YrrM